MKTFCTRNLFLTGGLLLMTGALSIQAANVTKLNTTTMNNGAADWSSAPLTTDVGEFGSTPTAGTLAAMTVGGPLTLGGLQLDGNLAGPLTITDANTLTLGTSGINALTANNNATLNFPLALGGSQTWSVGSGRTLTAGGIVSDGGSGFGLTETGSGTLTLTNNNTYTGGTTNNGGTLNLDFTGGAANNIISGSALALGGGTLNVIGAASGTSSQTFGSTALSAGGNVINVGTNGNATTLNLGAITVTKGATVNFSTTGSITTTTLGQGTATVLGAIGNVVNPVGYATYGTSDWAVTSGSSPYTITALGNVGSYTAMTGAGSFAGTGTTGNYDVTGNVTINANGGGGTVRFNTPSANTFTNLSKWVIVGAWLVTPNMGATNVIESGPSSWYSYYSTGAAQSGIIWQNNTSGYFYFNGPIGNGRDNANSPLTYIQAGPGAVVMGHANTYTGPSCLNGGFTVVGADNGLGVPATGATVNLNGGTVVATNTFTMENTPGVNERPFAIGNNGGGLAAITGTTMTIDGVVSNAIGARGYLNIGIAASSANSNTQGLLPGSGSGTANATPVMATGTVALSGANSYSGGTILQSGTVLISGINNLGGSGTYGGVTFNGGTLQYASGASGAGSLDLSSSTGIKMASGGGTIDLNGNTITYANAIGNGGSGQLTVASSIAGGSLTLGGANTYTGGTVVNGGATLLVNGSLPAGTVTVNGTLGGTGSVGGNVVWNSGAAATLTAGTPMTVAGTATLNGNTVNVAGSGLTSSGSPYTLLTATGGFTGGSTVSSIPGGGAIAAGYTGSVTISGNNIILTVTAVPSASWTDGDATGNWSDALNWNATFGTPPPSGAQATAIFGTGASPVNLNVPETVGTVSFTSSTIPYTISGASTLTLDNSGGGAQVTMSSGAANATISTAVSLNDSLTATAASGDTLAISGNISSTSTTKKVAVNGAGTVALSGNNSYGPSAAGTVGTTLSAGTLQVGNNSALGAGDLSVTAGSTLQAGATLSGVNNNIVISPSVTVTVNGSSPNSMVLGGVISGASGSVVKTGNGTVTLGGANTYAGNTTVNGGFLSISTGGAAGNPSSLGTVPSSFSANNIILNGGGLLGNSTLALNANRGITLNGTGLLDAASGATMTVGGIIAGNANGITVNSGAGDTGTVVLGGANTFNGTTFLNAGELSLSNSLALQNSTLLYSNSNGGTLDFSVLTTATFGGLAGTNNLSLTNTTAAPVALTIGGNNSTTSYTGILGGSGSLDKEGTGAITIGSGTNGGASYTGATTVNNGTMTLGGVGVMSAGNNIIQITGANGNSALNVAGSAVITTTGEIFVANGGLVNGTPSSLATVVIQNNASVSGGSLAFGNGTRPGDGSSLTVQDSAALTVSGSFDLYNGFNTGNSTENLDLNGGRATVGNFLASGGSASHQSRINFNGGELAAATNDTGGTNFLPALAGLVVDVTNTLPAIFVNTNGFTNTIAAVLTNSTANPDGGLVKRGGGTLILSAPSAYNGPTIVSKGVLVVSNSIGTGYVLINTNGTLGGIGPIGGSVTNVGTLAPGIENSSAGTTLTINTNLTLQPGSTNVMRVSSDNNNNDIVSASGTITYGGTLVILTNVTDTTSLFPGKTYTLFSASGGISGSFTSIQPAPGPGLMWINDPSNPGQFDVVAAPTTAGFTGTPTNGSAPLQVVFTDASIASYGNSITNWAWSFGDGNGVTNMSNANVTNTYAASGSYTVSLIVTDTTGNSSTNTQTAYIVVQSAQQPPVSVFSGTPRNIFAKQTVVFTNSSTGSYTNSAWSFGDGNVANLSGAGVSNNVSDTYTNAGAYTVQLIVTGAGGSGTNTQSAYIVVKPKPALGKPVLSGGNFMFTGTNGPAGEQYRILNSTNVALPLASWTPVFTNAFASDGSYGYTNSAPTNKASFFLLVSP